MRTPTCFALGLLAVCFAATPAVAADDITGTWKFVVDVGGNQGMPTFELKQEGEKLSGKYKGQFGEAEVKGTVKEKEVEFTFELEGGNKVVYKGKIEGEEMKGTCDYAGQAEGTWTAKKEEEKKS
jgi:hypothetical protein